jgi:hypothetical protein
MDSREVNLARSREHPAIRRQLPAIANRNRLRLRSIQFLLQDGRLVASESSSRFPHDFLASKPLDLSRFELLTAMPSLLVSVSFQRWRFGIVNALPERLSQEDAIGQGE